MTRPALAAIRAREQRVYAAARPQSQALASRASTHFPQGVPMHWMRDWGTVFPMYVREARGSVLVDVDGNSLADFCLGDTGAMFGHSPPPVAQAIAAQSEHGLTCMLPAANAAVVGEALAEVFGLPWWQLTQTATDANRAVLRLARAATGRGAVLVFNHCYHGTVDETLVVRAPDGRTIARPGQVGPLPELGARTRVVEFNDLPAVEAALADGDVACVLAEPVMTNAGMVLPQPGFLEGLRTACTRKGTLLAIDETHTLSTGRGGYARVHGLPADMLVVGKAVAGGLPCAVYGYTAAVAALLQKAERARATGHSGLGTTLSANPLALAALHACLTQVMTTANHAHMDALASQLAVGIEKQFAARGVNWQVSRVGARLEFGRAPAPVNGSQSLASADPELAAAMQLFLLNRGFLLTPFHNMMLLSPATTPRQLAAFLVAFGHCLDEFAPIMGYA